MTDSAGLHGIKDGGHSVEEGLTAETDGDFLSFLVFGEAGKLKGLFDERGEIIVLDVAAARPFHDISGENLIGIRLRILDAVRGENHGAGEVRQFLLLILPGRAKVAREMRESLQLRISVGGEHLAVGVHVDALPFGLLQNLIEIREVMAGNENAVALAVPGGNGGRFGIAEGLRIAGVKKLHSAHVGLAAVESEPQPIVKAAVRAIIRGSGEQTAHIEHHVMVTLPETGGMIGVRGNALEAEEDNLHGGAHIGVFSKLVGRRGGGEQLLCLGGRIGGHTLQRIPLIQDLADELLQGNGIEVDIGQR